MVGRLSNKTTQRRQCRRRDIPIITTKPVFREDSICGKADLHPATARRFPTASSRS